MRPSLLLWHLVTRATLQATPSLCCCAVRAIRLCRLRQAPFAAEPEAVLCDYLGRYTISIGHRQQASWSGLAEGRGPASAGVFSPTTTNQKG